MKTVAQRVAAGILDSDYRDGILTSVGAVLDYADGSDLDIDFATAERIQAACLAWLASLGGTNNYYWLVMAPLGEDR